MTNMALPTERAYEILNLPLGERFTKYAKTTKRQNLFLEILLF